VDETGGFYTSLDVDLGYHDTLDKALDAAIEGGAIEDGRTAALRRWSEMLREPHPVKSLTLVPVSLISGVGHPECNPYLLDIVLRLRGPVEDSWICIAPVYEPPRL